MVPPEHAPHTAAEASGAAPTSSVPSAAGSFSLRAVLVWAGATVVLASTAAALGVFGVFGEPSSTSVTRRAVTALDCPWKDPAATLPAGSRVLAVATAQGGWVGVRNPADLDQVVWLQTSELRADPGQDELDTLPGLPCDEQLPSAPPSSEVPTSQPGAVQDVAAPAPTSVPSSVTSSIPTSPPTTRAGTASPGGTIVPPTTAATPSAGAPVAPAPTSPAPAPTTVPRDTTPPVISQAAASPVEICDVPQTGWSNTSNITALVSDDRGVTSVVATFSGSVAPPLTLAARPNKTYTGTFTPTAATAPANRFVDVTITLTARDAANNTTTKTLPTVRVYDLGQCLA